MNYFVSYELLDPADKSILFVGSVVITNATVGGIQADLEAIKNDNGYPDSMIRVIRFVLLPSEPSPTT